MHVVQILPELNEGGVERGTVECNRAFVRRGLHSTVISRGGRLAVRIGADGGRHVACDVCSKNILTAWGRARALRRILTRLRPDIVHVRSRVPAWLVRLANRRLRLPVVTTVHGFYRPNAYSRIMVRGDRVICVSRAIRDYVQRAYGTPEAALRVIHRGIDPSSFDPARLDASFLKACRQRWHLDGRFVAVAAGRITELKDFETFLRAVAQARRELPALCGLIVGGAREGKQAYLDSLRALAASLGIANDVIFAGSQSRMAEMYALGGAVVSSSRRPESFGRSIVEALAMERPVVAARHGGALEIVRDGENGFFFEPGDAAGLATALLACSRRTFTGLRDDALARFSLDRMVDETIGVYRELTHA